MMTVTPLHRGALSVLDYRCHAGPHTPVQTECHALTSVSYVRRGSFGYRARGQEFELVAGSLLVGQCGDEFVCTHDHHHGGDECLSFKLAPELLDSFGAAPRLWRAGGLPPLPELMVLGELAQAAADGRSDFGLDEAGLLLVGRYLALANGQARTTVAATARDRRRAVAAALWLDAHAHEDIDLQSRGRPGRTQRVSLPAPVRARGRRDAASVPAARTAASRGAAAHAGRRAHGHRYRPRCRLCRSVEFRPQLPSRGGRFTAAFPPCRARRPRADHGVGPFIPLAQFFPRPRRSPWRCWPPHHGDLPCTTISASK